MPLFDAKKKPFSYDVVREGEDIILMIDCENYTKLPSIEDDPTTMSKASDMLLEVRNATKIVFAQKRNYEYDYSQILLLKEIASLYNQLVKRKDFLSYNALVYDATCTKCTVAWYAELQHIISSLLRSDPVGAYVELKRMERREKIKEKKIVDTRCIKCEEHFIAILDYIIGILDKTKLITLARPHLAGYKIGDRDVYRIIFKPTIKPDFMFTKLMASYPVEGEEIDNYSVGNTEVTIFSVPETIQYLYHIMPPEFKLSEEQYEILDTARKIMAEHKPKKSEFVDPERMRQVFYNVGHDLIEELLSYRGITLSSEETDELTNILVRYTVGFGLIEVLLQDEKIQDITINSPMGSIPIFIVHQDYDDCQTNIIPTIPEAESWASKLRMVSGRPLDEANPILDTELILPGARTRVAVISSPLNPTGLAYAFRRHRDRPWTLPLFINNKMLSPLAAGIISFLVDGSRTMLIAGTRSSGKTSLLGAILTEIMRKYRVITIEDTLELPTESLRKLGYNIQSMKVAAAMAKGTAEVPADEGIRTTLRMGDSCLIIGEVRSSIRGNEEVMIVKNGENKRIPIKELEGKDITNVYVPTLNKNLKISLTKLTDFVKHPSREKLLEVITKTGRKVTVTPDHSIFTAKDFTIYPIETNKLKKGDKIVIPASMPSGYNDIDYINLIKLLPNFRVINAEKYIRKAIAKLGWRKASKICNTIDIYCYLRKPKKRANLPIKYFKKLMKEAKLSYSLKDLKIKKGTSATLPALFPVNEDFCRFLGYYIAEGYSSAAHGITITSSEKAIIDDVIAISKKLFEITPSIRTVKGLGESKQMRITNKALADLITKLGCGRTSGEKRIPSITYGFKENKICALLKGMYSGDGSFTATKRAGNLLRYFTTSEKLAEDVLYLLLTLGIVARIFKRKQVGLGKRELYTIEFKQRKFVERFLNKVGFTNKKPILIKKAFAHTKDNSVNFNPKQLEKHLKLPRKYRHLRRTCCCSKDYLQRITNEISCSNQLSSFANGDFYLDEIKEINELNINPAEPVYDLSVNPTENFIGGFGGIILHNTEARALYEAMRVGAMANVVAGTIHGDSPYGVFDRVVNDLQVPRTSFKATDIVVVANPVRSADGLHRWRRVTEITEVRKHWEQDPLLENGFVDLMKYDTRTDQLEPSGDLINGDSEILKAVAGNVKEWAGNWDAVWDNIMLRTKIKETLVDFANKIKMPNLLEAPFVIRCNDEFHRIADKVKEDVGNLDSKRIFFTWNEWLKREVKKKGM